MNAGVKNVYHVKVCNVYFVTLTKLCVLKNNDRFMNRGSNNEYKITSKIGLPEMRLVSSTTTEDMLKRK